MDFLNALVALANFVFIPAIAYGSQLALGALGVTLIYGILRFSNFAHGDTMAMGTMATILMTWLFQSMGLSLGVLPTALLALPFGIAFDITDSYSTVIVLFLAMPVTCAFAALLAPPPAPHVPVPDLAVGSRIE